MDTRLLMGGERVAGEGAPLTVEDPAREERLAELAGPSPEQLDAAVESARRAQRGWALTPAAERAEALHELAARLRIETKLEVKDWWYPYG